MAVPWELIVNRLRRMVELSDKSMSAHARELKLSPAALSRILSGETEEPQPNTQERIRHYVQRELERTAFPHLVPRDELETEGIANATELSPEQDLLEYFLEHHEQLGTFMTLQAKEAPTAEDRRKIYFWGLNALKRAHVELGEPIPPVLFELERRLLEGTRE